MRFSPPPSTCPVFALSALLLLLSLPAPSTSKTFETRVDTLSSFVYLDRFVFNKVSSLGDSTASQLPSSNFDDKKAALGLVTYDITYINGTAPELLLYFSDRRGFATWTEVYLSPSSCGRRREEAKSIISITELNSYTNKLSGGRDINGRPTTRAEGYFFFDNATPKWFFMVLANCKPPTEEKMRCIEYGYCQGPNVADVRLVMTNGDLQMSKHFSFDELGIREIYIFFFTCQLLLFILSRWIRALLLTANKLHTTANLLMWSVLAQLVALAFSLAHYQNFALTGDTVVGTRVAGDVIASVAELLIVYLLIFLAKGWSLIRYKISSAGRVKIAVLMTFTVFWELALQSWKAAGIDSATIVYIYNTGPGLMIIWIRIFTTGWFVYSCWTTIKSFDNKKHFYRKFLVAGAIWLLLRPIMAFICNGSVADTIRQKYMVGWETAVIFVAHLALLLMYMPNQRFNKGFPFHSVSSAMLGLVQGQSASQYILEQQRLALAAQGGADDGTSTSTAAAAPPGLRASPSGRAGNFAAPPPQVQQPAALSGESGNAAAARGGALSRGGRNNPALSTFPAAKRAIRDVGTELHRTMSELGSAGEDLLARLRDLDDVEGDVDFDERNRSAEPRRILQEDSGW